MCILCTCLVISFTNHRVFPQKEIKRKGNQKQFSEKYAVVPTSYRIEKKSEPQKLMRVNWTICMQLNFCLLFSTQTSPLECRCNPKVSERLGQKFSNLSNLRGPCNVTTCRHVMSLFEYKKYNNCSKPVKE